MHKKRFHHRRPPPPQKKQNIKYILDEFSTNDIRKWERIKDYLLSYHWDFYSSLAYQRSRIADEIKKCLCEAVEKDYPFSKWQRTVMLKYSVEPLSVRGGLLDQAGGRFNIGDIKPSEFLPFPALYIASDRETALQEVICSHLGVIPNGLNTLDFALTDTSSISHVSISGHLDAIINLNKPETLQPFMELFKDFTVPDHIKNIAKVLKIEEPTVIKTVSKLLESLMWPNWREWPMQYDVPVASQIFGQMVSNAGIEGILYKSKFTNKDCLAIFPQNFESGSSFVQLDDAPPKETKVSRWNAQTWRENKDI